MGQKIKLDDTEYDADNLTDEARAALASIQFISKQIQEFQNMQAILQRAKNSYADSLKKEILASKAGLLLSDN